MKEESREIFIKRLSAIMEKKGLSQTELASRTGISIPSISRYLSGKSEPRGSELVLISIALDASMDYLYGLDEIKYERWKDGGY